MSDRLSFVHLRVHTEYSLLEGAVRVKDLAALCARHNMPALGICDTNNLFGAFKVSQTLVDAGIQPIIGIQLTVSVAQFDLTAPLVLLAQNQTGYMNLMHLATRAYDDGSGLPQVAFGAVLERSEGLICLTGGPSGLLSKLLQENDKASADTVLQKLQDGFSDRLYIEIQRHLGEGGLPVAEAESEPLLIDFAYKSGVPLVATNDVYFPKRDFFPAHEALICIGEGTYVDQKASRRSLTPEHYFKSQEEMRALFADIPEALENTVEIARRTAFSVQRATPILPKFADDEEAELREQAVAGLRTRLSSGMDAASEDAYFERLEFELEVIRDKGYCGYFLIVADFIKWARMQGIPVGLGRGSGAGSLVAYALTITGLDPLRYGLFFERFLNPQRASMPDFDIDFCTERRDEVMRYVQQKYGAHRVAQIITFGALLSKMAVRDIGRVLQMPYGQVDKIAKMIPSEGNKPVSIDQALSTEPRLRDAVRAEEVVGRLMDYAGQLEGLLRNASTHAAGIVIGDRPLEEIVALYRDPRATLSATQFSMGCAEAVGLVKFDFLGLKNLTVICQACTFLKQRGIEIDLDKLPLDDEKTFALYSAARTIGVFQVESVGMMSTLRQLRPTTIEDIIALVALYRPGPMENIPKFCEVKNGLSEREYLHPLIDQILDETQGIIVYQEQVMLIAQKMAGYSLGEADLLRRAMGKKIQAAMDKEKPRFLDGAKKNNVSEEDATKVWNLLDKFANYGFNKSHAAAYGIISYQTAWLKANHPVEFMAALMQCDINSTDKLAVYAAEARKPSNIGGMGIAISLPCINRSKAAFFVENGAIFYALGALKNVGLEAMRLVETARNETPFVNIFDFARRVDLRKIGKRSLEMLISAGAFDQLDDNRARLMSELSALVSYSGAWHDEQGSDQVSLFGDSGVDLPEPRFADIDDWDEAERLEAEFAAVGFYLSGHPLDKYMAKLSSKNVKSLAQMQALAERESITAKMIGTVTKVKERKSARNKRFAFVSLSDPTGAYEITLFSEALEQARAYLVPGAQIIFWAAASFHDENFRLNVNKIDPLDTDKMDNEQTLKIYIEHQDALPGIASILGKYGKGKTKGQAEIFLCFIGASLAKEALVSLEEKFAINTKIIAALRAVSGVAAIEIL